MNLKLVILAALLVLSCSRTKDNSRLHGDYYIKLIYLRLDNLPDSILTSIENGQRNYSDTLTAQEKVLSDLVAFLKRNNLLRKPHVYVRQDDGTIQTLFLNVVDYDKISQLNSNLIEEGMRIEIETDVKQIRFDSVIFYEAVGTVRIKKRRGKTYWEK